MQFKGYIEVHVKDKDTHETLNIIKEENVVTDSLLQFFVANYSSNQSFAYGNNNNPYIGISSDTQPQHRAWQWVNNYPTLPTTITANVIQTMTWVERNGSTPQYVQYYTRFNPANQWINTIFLCGGNSFSTTGQPYPYSAYALLSQTCVQTNLQYLDVYYRIEFPWSAATGIPEATYRALCRQFILFNESTDVLTFNGYLNNALPMPSQNILTQTGTPAVSGNSGEALIGFNNNTHNNLIGGTPNYSTLNNMPYNYGAGYSNNIAYNTSYYKSSFYMNYDTQEHMGKLFCVIMPTAETGNYVVSPSTQILTWTPLNTTNQIQTLFGQNSTANTPFMDINYLANGSGNVIAGGGWVSNHLPETYLINITGTGNIGTSTYNYQKRKHMGYWPSGTVGFATWQDHVEPVAPLCISNQISIPDGAGGTYQEGIYPQANGNPTHGISRSAHDSSLKYNNQEVIYWDSTGITHYDLANGGISNIDSNVYPSFTPTSITQVSVGVDGTIWAACTATGLWKIVPTMSNGYITSATISNQLPAGVTANCYGVDIGFGGNICALFNGGYSISDTAGGISWTTHSPGTINSNYANTRYLKVDSNSVNYNTLFAEITGPTLWWDAVANTSTGPSFSYAHTWRHSIDCSPVSSKWTAGEASLSPYDNSSLVQHSFQLLYGTDVLFNLNTPNSAPSINNSWSVSNTLGLYSDISPASSVQFDITDINANVDAVVVPVNSTNMTITPTHMMMAWIETPQSITYTNATYLITTGSAHGFNVGDVVIFGNNRTGQLGNNLYNPSVVYYVISTNLTANTFEVSTSAGGSAQYLNGGSNVGNYVARYHRLYRYLSAKTSTVLPVNTGFNASSYLTGITNFINLGNGMMLTRQNSYLGNLGSYGQTAQLVNWAGDGNKAGGNFAHIVWENFGWNGSAWISGSVTSKPTHATTDLLDNGVTLTFNDGVSTPSFTATDSYVFSVCNGILKDNATTMSYQNGLYFKPITSGNVFYPSTLTTTAGNVGAIHWGNLITSGQNITVDGLNRLNVPGLSSNLVTSTGTVSNYVPAYPVGGQSTDLLIGDFQVDFTNLSGVNNFLAGVGNFDPRNFLDPVYPQPSTSPTGYYEYNGASGFNSGQVNNGPGQLGALTFNFYVNAGTIKYYYWTGAAGSRLFNYSNAITVTGSDTISIQRVGTTVSYLKNGTVIATISTVVPTQPLRVSMGTAGTSQAAPFVSPTATISTNGTLTYTYLGDPVAKTGIYDPLYYITEQLSGGLTNININGTPAAHLYYNSYANPNPGEIAILAWEGIAIGNVANAGQTITGNYSWLSQPN